MDANLVSLFNHDKEIWHLLLATMKENLPVDPPLRPRDDHLNDSHLFDRASDETRTVRRVKEDGASPATHSNQPALDFNRPSRERTLTLMRMCLLSYPSCQERTRHNKTCGYRDAVMEPILRRREAVLGPSITDRES